MEMLISVIVPVYNVEKYLSRCINSLMNQTYKNIEIILVDDGSTDNSPDICDSFELIDKRIKVIHKKNGGLSDARNAGLNLAVGEFIGFVDSDDYVSEDFIEVLYNVMCSEKSDIVECSVTKFFENNSFDSYIDDLKISNYTAEEALSGLIDENPFRQHVWNKLYKKELIFDIPFALGKTNEDEFWTYQIFGRSQRITRVNRTMYYYFQRSNSIMGENYNIRRLDALEGIKNRCEYIDDYFPALSLKAKLNLYGACMFAYQSVLKYLKGEEKKNAIRKVNSYRKKVNVSLKDISFVNASSRKYYYLSKISFFLCCKIRCIMGIGF